MAGEEYAHFNIVTLIEHGEVEFLTESSSSSEISMIDESSDLTEFQIAFNNYQMIWDEDQEIRSREIAPLSPPYDRIFPGLSVGGFSLLM